MISAETACWEIERNSQMFDEDFYLPLYLSLCILDTTYNRTCICFYSETPWEPFQTDNIDS